MHTNFALAGFELESLGPQAGMLPSEPHLLEKFTKVLVNFSKSEKYLDDGAAAPEKSMQPAIGSPSWN